jgi:hypothetical protein
MIWKRVPTVQQKQRHREETDMAYFDSPKNSAKWEKEMVGLRAERARREAGGYDPQEKKAEAEGKGKSRVAGSKAAGKDMANDPRHRPITLKELEQIDARMSGIKRVKRPTRQRMQGMEMQTGTMGPTAGAKAAKPV